MTLLNRIFAWISGYERSRPFDRFSGGGDVGTHKALSAGMGRAYLRVYEGWV